MLILGGIYQVVLGGPLDSRSEEIICEVAASKSSAVMRAFGEGMRYKVGDVKLKGSGVFQCCDFSINSTLHCVSPTWVSNKSLFISNLRLLITCARRVILFSEREKGVVSESYCAKLTSLRSLRRNLFSCKWWAFISWTMRVRPSARYCASVIKVRILWKQRLPQHIKRNWNFSNWPEIWNNWLCLNLIRGIVFNECLVRMESSGEFHLVWFGTDVCARKVSNHPGSQEVGLWKFDLSAWWRWAGLPTHWFCTNEISIVDANSFPRLEMDGLNPN